MQDLGGGVWTGFLSDLLGCAAVLGLLFLASLLAIIVRRRRRSRHPAAAASDAPCLDRDREWELVMRVARHGLPRAPRLAELQADATITIESAEHAYRRLLVDFARACKASPTPESPAPGLEPVPEPERAPEEPVEQPLAA